MENYFTQLCVWPGCILGDGQSPATFEAFMRNNFFGVRVRFAEEVETLVPQEAGTDFRHDLFFYVHSEDIPKFAVRRLSFGIHWWEDVLSNGHQTDYYPETLEKYPNVWKQSFAITAGEHSES